MTQWTVSPVAVVVLLIRSTMFRSEVVVGDRQPLDVFFDVFDAGRVVAGVHDAVDGEPGVGCGAAYQVDDDLVCSEGSSPPVHGDLGEQPVLYFVPFAGARRQVADRDFQAGLGGEVQIGR